MDDDEEKLTPAMRKLRAQIAAHTSWAKTEDWSARTAPARQAALDRFEKQVDPDGTMDPVMRAKRADSLRTAYFKGLALRSAEVRRANRRG